MGKKRLVGLFLAGVVSLMLIGCSDTSRVVISDATYGYYDENDNCLGYAQQRAIRGDDSHAYVYPAV